MNREEMINKYEKMAIIKSRQIKFITEYANTVKNEENRRMFRQIRSTLSLELANLNSKIEALNGMRIQ